MSKFVTCHPEFISGSYQREISTSGPNIYPSGSCQHEANAPINRMLKLVQHDRVCWNKAGIGFSAPVFRKGVLAFG